MPFRRKAKPKAESGTPQLVRIVPRGTQYELPLPPRPLSMDFDAIEELPPRPIDESSKIVKSQSVEFQRPAQDRLEVDAHHPFATQERRRRKLTPLAPSPEQRGLSPPASPAKQRTPSPPAGQKKPVSPRHRVVHVQIVPLMKPVNHTPEEEKSVPSNGAKSSQPQNFYAPKRFHSPENPQALKTREVPIRSKSVDAAEPQRQAFRHHHHVPRDELERLREHRKNPPTAPPPYQSKTTAQSSHPRHNIQIVPLMSPVDKTPRISPGKPTPVQREKHQRKIVASKSLDFEVPAKQKPTVSPLSPDPGYSSRSPSWSEHPYKQPTPLSEPLGRSPVAVRDQRAPRGTRPASYAPEGMLARITAIEGNDSPRKVRKPVKSTGQQGGLGPAPVSYS